MRDLILLASSNYCCWLVRITAASDLVPNVYINSNNSDVINVTFQITNIVNTYPDIVIKRYSNNGGIVDVDDEYLRTSEWRFTNWLFQLEQIQ